MMQSLHRDIEATTAGDVVHFTAWRHNPHEQLVRSGSKAQSDTSAARTLRDAVARGVSVRALLYHPQFVLWTMRKESQAAARLLRAAGCKVVLDSTFPFAGSHHQKSFFLSSGDTTVAYIGGVDIAPDRWDTPLHDGDPRRSRELFDGWHDVHSRILGPATAEVASSFCERWNDERRLSFLPPRSRKRRAPAPEPSHEGRGYQPGNDTVQILRTYAAGPRRPRYPSFAPRGDHTYLASYLKAIGQARRYIYIEDQYFVSQEIVGALAEAIPRINGLIIVIPSLPEPAPGFVRNSIQWHQRRAINTLLSVDDRKVQVLTLRDSSGQRAIWVHAKVLLIDDEYAAIGSANMNRRSLTHDSELGIAVVSDETGGGRFAEHLRRHLWAEHLSLHAEDDDIADPVAALDVWSERAATSGARIRPYLPEAGRRHRLLWHCLIDPDGSR